MGEDNPGHRLGDDQPSKAPPAPSALGLPDDSDPSDSPPSLTTTATQNANTNDDGNTSQDTPNPPKGKSIAHYDLKANRMVFVSLDIETNAVDRNDRVSADYTTSLRTHRWYLRIFFWLFDRVIHQLYVIVIYYAKCGIGPDEWEVYLKKNG